MLNLTYSSSSLYGPIALWGFIFGVIGALILIVSYVHGAIKTYKTKDTSQVSLLMWIITFLGALFLCIFFLLGVILTSANLSFTLMFVLQVIILIPSIYVFSVKVTNIHQAKLLNISEKEYCQQIVTIKNKKEAK